MEFHLLQFNYVIFLFKPKLLFWGWGRGVAILSPIRVCEDVNFNNTFIIIIFEGAYFKRINYNVRGSLDCKGHSF